MAKITYELLKEKLAGTQVPVLTLDERWYKLIPEKEKTEEISNLETTVNDYLKKQGQVNTDLKEVKKIKAKLIQDVVDNMEEDGAQDAKHKKLMSQNQRLIQEAKEKITALEDESMEVPKLLNEANLRLLAATLQYSFERLNTNKEDIELLDKWINDTRIKLKKKILIKQDKETKNNKMYGYMHDILGPDLMGDIDKLNELD